MLPLPHLLIVFGAISGTVLLFGGGAWLWYRTSRLEERLRQGSAPRSELASDLEELRRELAGTREEIRQMGERLDFVERLLEGPDEPDAPGRLEGGGEADEPG